MSEPLRWVELPLGQVIAIHHGFWMCMLRARPGQPGAGRHWETADKAEAAGFAHLGAVHQLRALHRDPIDPASSIEGSHDPDCPRCPVLPDDQRMW